MKTIFLLKSNFTHQGGLEKWARLLTQAFLKKDYRVVLLTSGSIDTPNLPPQMEVHSLKRTYPISFLRVLKFDAFCQDFIRRYQLSSQSSLVFGLDRNSFQTHFRAGNGVHRAYLHQRSLIEGAFRTLGHGLNPLHRTLLSLEKRAFEHPSLQKVFTNSEMVKREILHYYQLAEDKITVIHNGVEWQDFKTPFSEWVDRYPHFRRNRIQLLFVGHGFRRKGLEPLLRGLHQLKNKDAHLSVVGHDKEMAYFQKLTHKLQLHSQVCFHGAQKDIRPFYQMADSLVIPSYYDPFANVTVEALSFGLFVVSSKYNGGCEVLTPQTGCLIEDLSNPESVAEALKEAIKHVKTVESATRIRHSIKHLDLSIQLERLVQHV